MTTVLRYAKAVAGGVVAGAAAVTAATADGHVSLTEWLVIAGAVIAGSGIVAAVPNKPPA